MTDVLLELVDCERFRPLFPSGTPRRACLRRQLERRREGKGWAPTQPGCVECLLGRDVRAAVEAAGVQLGTCEGCGAAIVDARSCEACAAAGREAPQGRQGERTPCPGCGSVSKHAAGCSRPPRTVRRDGSTHRRPGAAPSRLGAAPVSTLIWSQDVPDVPIGPPPATSAERGVHRAQPAGFGTIGGRALRSEPMPCCGSKGSRHLSTCKERGEPPKPAKKAVLPVAEVHARRAAEIAKRKGKAPPAANGPAYVTPVADLSDEDLARSIAECRAELERRQAEHEARAKKLAEVIASIGEAA